MSASPTYHLRLFGSPSIEADDGGGTPLTGRVVQRHRLALLALIAMAPGQRLSRDKLIAYLWPESDSERGRNLLKVSSYVIRGELGESALLTEGDDLRLNGEVVRTDAIQLDAALARGEYTAAVALYRGPFLDGFFLSHAPEFEQWAARERERLASRYVKALEALAEQAEVKGDAATAADWWKRRAAQDPYDSRIALRLMRSLEASGNRAAALQHASVHQRLLEQEFGIAAGSDVMAFAEQLRKKPPVDAYGSPARESQPDGALPASPPAPMHQPARIDGNRGRRLSSKSAFVLTSVALGAAALWTIGPGLSQPPERSIAVLPFINMSSEGDDESFNDGLTEEIITGLSAVPELRVISRTSAMHYKGTEKPLPEIARELGVAHILEGSVRKSGGRVRISAQLIDARADEHLWAESYESDLSDVFDVQERIARQVVRALEVELGEHGDARLVRQGTRDSVAYQLYRRARYLWNTRTREGHRRAIAYYQQAIARDSSYADAYAGLSDTYRTAWQLGLSDLSETETLARAKWAAERALALDDKSADAHVSVATSLEGEKDWRGAERELRRALELNPSHATAHTWYSLLLAGLGRPREALEESRRAYELDPFAIVPSSNYGWQCYLARDYDCAIDQYRRTLEMGPSFGRTHARLAMAYAHKGMLDDAVRALQRAIKLHPERPDFVADLAYVQALRGETTAARETLERAKLEPFEPFNIGRAYVALQEPDSAFVWLERSRWQWPHRAVLSDPGLDPVRTDARFARLVERVERDMGIRR
ncbi:MAG TPA: BTAD domain-containing putative transcriptional regulator [Gemmatimonadaceae bacterium]|nr:BTAD domain-containing putative transcriptional regulator [Gemmatimonadaceae bacterium]